MSVAVRAEELVSLAKARTPADRERLLLAITDLCDGADSAGALETSSIQALLNDIFMCLVVEAERSIRQRLAEKLAKARWAPRALINVLALDEIEIARPIIAASPVLQDRDLIRLLVEATIEHQIEVARRPAIGPLVVDAILTQSEPAVLTALATNKTAEVSPAAMTRLVDASLRVTSLRAPLARHPLLTTGMAERLYAWVGEALRTDLVGRFKVDAQALDSAIAEAAREARDDPFGELRADLVLVRADEREAMERQLVSKLWDAGQLRPGYLLRALREGKLSLFEAALARLGGFSTEQVRLALAGDRPELLALACFSVGLDRSAFPTLLALVRSLNGGKPAGPPDVVSNTFSAFGPHPPAAAAAAFRHAVSAV